MAKREPNGQTKRSLRNRDPNLASPAEVARMRDAALAGLKDPVWATQIGILHLQGKLTASQFAAGARWASLARDYSAAVGAPRQPRSANLDPTGGTPADPDTLKGALEARQHTRTVHHYLGALETLRRTGEAPRLAVRDTCEFNLHPAGSFQLAALRTGLQALAAWWSGK